MLIGCTPILTMPRGLGQMQRFLLAALKPAKLAYASGKFDYVGGAGSENSKAKGCSGDRELMPISQLLVNKGGEYWALDPKVYDLRCTLRYLAIHWPKRKNDYPACWQKWWKTPTYGSSSYWCVSDPFRVSFMRAARSLVDRGSLIACDDDGAPQLRFVSLASDLEREYEARKDRSAFEL
jgi:hypothetical protein